MQYVCNSSTVVLEVAQYVEEGEEGVCSAVHMCILEGI